MGDGNCNASGQVQGLQRVVRENVDSLICLQTYHRVGFFCFNRYNGKLGRVGNWQSSTTLNSFATLEQGIVVVLGDILRSTGTQRLGR